MIVRDGKVAFLDFGATFDLEPEVSELQKSIYQEKTDGDLRIVYQSMLAQGVLNEELLGWETFSQGIGEQMISPFHQDRVRPYHLEGERDLASFLLERVSPHAFNLKDRLFTPFMLEQALANLFTILGAELNWHQLLRDCLRESE